MHPPPQALNLDVETISGILGSISIACWVVVFTPQILENFQRSSAEGVSIVFLVIWLLGDVFNILGSVLQGVLPTMIVLAVYYTIADIVLIGQVFYYRGFTLKDAVTKASKASTDDDSPPSEHTTLLANDASRHNKPAKDTSRARSASSFRERLLSTDAVHFSPVTPLHPQSIASDVKAAITAPATSESTLRTVLKNAGAILTVCLAGIIGWYISTQTSRHGHQSGGHTEKEVHKTLEFNVLGQVFGYVCAALYLGSRIPQLLLNYRRKSTEGLSLLFFLFACMGNATYVLSILAYEPACMGRHVERDCEKGEAARDYGRNVVVNFSWLLGSFGTLFLDAAVFAQYFLYRKDGNAAGSMGSEDAEGGEVSGMDGTDNAPSLHSWEGRGRNPNTETALAEQ